MFKDRLKALRKANGLTQKDLARVIGVDVSTVGKWEGKGNILPSDGVRERIADYFRVPLDFVMDRETSDTWDADTQQLVSIFSQLNGEGRQLVLDYANMIAQKYTQEGRVKSAM